MQSLSQPRTSDLGASGLRVFGLTGGIASGKSTVAAHWRSRGLPVLDADAHAREVVLPGSEALLEIAREFGADLVTSAGLDRKLLGKRVFGQPDQLLRLEAIVHPRVQALRQRELERCERAGEPLACCEIPLLFERNLDAELRPVVVVSLPEALQLARAQARDGLPLAEVQARVAAQLPLREKAARADYVIDNRGSPDALRAEADRILSAICAQFGIDASRYGLAPATPPSS